DRILRDRARRTPGRIAVADWTYADLDRRSDEIAARLEYGSRISTLTRNSPEHVAVFFGCAKAGAILHPISWPLPPTEIAYQLDDAEPAVFLVEDEFRELADGALALAAASPARELSEPGEPPAPDDDDPLLLVYTSGTTGTPKGALLTHANCFWTNLS